VTRILLCVALATLALVATAQDVVIEIGTLAPLEARS